MDGKSRLYRAKVKVYKACFGTYLRILNDPDLQEKSSSAILKVAWISFLMEYVRAIIWWEVLSITDRQIYIPLWSIYSSYCYEKYRIDLWLLTVQYFIAYFTNMITDHHSKNHLAIEGRAEYTAETLCCWNYKIKKVLCQVNRPDYRIK